MELLSKQVAEILDSATIPAHTFDVRIIAESIEGEPPGPNVVLMQQEATLGYILNKHGYKSLIYYGKNIEQANDRFISLWRQYLDQEVNQHNWWMAYRAFYTEYNPVENYDRKTDSTTTYQGKETNRTDYNGKDKTTLTNDIRVSEDKSYVATDESDAYHAEGKMESKQANASGGKPEDTSEHEFFNRYDKSEKNFEDRKDILKERVHGNAGTTKNQEMVEDEYNLRFQNMAYRIVDNFINTFCTYLN